MVFRFPFAHIPSRLAENRRRGHNVDPVNLRQIRTGRAKQLCTQVELRRIPLLFLPKPLLPFLFRQIRPCAPVFPLLEVLLQPLIALRHLLLAKLVTILFLLQHKQQIFLPVALQTPRDLLAFTRQSRSPAS